MRAGASLMRDSNCRRASLSRARCDARSGSPRSARSRARRREGRTITRRARGRADARERRGSAETRRGFHQSEHLSELTTDFVRAQNETYAPRFREFVAVGDEVGLTAFFSPDTSADASASLVREAKESVDVFAPAVESWSGCGAGKTGCAGCAPDRVRASEAFVLFRELLNAAHRGVRVRLLTNRFDDVKECIGAVSVTSYFSENFDVRTYTSTTFMHAKAMIVDGNVTAISSVNWSKSSYLENREAGVVARSKSVAKFAGEVFEYDWSVAEVWRMPANDGISEDEIRRMKSSEWLEPFPIPSRNISAPHYSPKKQRETWCKGAAVKVSVSPDAGAMTMLEAMNATTSLDVYTYQITDDFFATRLLKLADDGVIVRIVLSRAIFSDVDRKLSTSLVDKMRENKKIVFRSSPRFYRYAHLKIMIVDRGRDSERVALATGNLSPSDLPLPVRPFIPCQKGGAAVNRDFEIVMHDANIVEQFQNLFDGDMAYTSPYRRPSKF